MRILNPEGPQSLATVESFDAAYGKGGVKPVAIFDFDGVLCSPREDLVYKLAERPDERHRLSQAAHHYRIDPALYDTAYLRHLVLQAILADRKMAPDPGPLLPLAVALSRAGRPFFVLTARSGRAAIDRALSFLDANKVTPQEIFFVGRVAKGRQLTLTRNSVSKPATVAYFEDSYRHSRNSTSQEHEGLETIYVSWTHVEKFAAQAFFDQILDWFEKGRPNRSAA